MRAVKIVNSNLFEVIKTATKHPTQIINTVNLSTSLPHELLSSSIFECQLFV